MFRSIIRVLPVALLMAGTAWAQAPAAPAPMKTGPSATSGSDEGPFPPLPNGEVAITKVPEPVPASPAPAVSAARATPAPADSDVQALEARAIRERLAEERLDRAEREHERERQESARNAGSIEGAYSGITDERDR
ncbi:MAG: hypothetical protein ACM3X5_08370 [Bacillota bacterium]